MLPQQNGDGRRPHPAVERAQQVGVKQQQRQQPATALYRPRNPRSLQSARRGRSRARPSIRHASARGTRQNMPPIPPPIPSPPIVAGSWTWRFDREAMHGARARLVEAEMAGPPGKRAAPAPRSAATPPSRARRSPTNARRRRGTSLVEQATPGAARLHGRRRAPSCPRSSDSSCSWKSRRLLNHGHPQICTCSVPPCIQRLLQPPPSPAVAAARLQPPARATPSPSLEIARPPRWRLSEPFYDDVRPRMAA